MITSFDRAHFSQFVHRHGLSVGPITKILLDHPSEVGQPPRKKIRRLESS